MTTVTDLRLVDDAVAEMLERERVVATPADSLWNRLVDAGLHRAGLGENAGGTGLGLAEAAAVVRHAGAHTTAAPLAETAMLGGWLLELAGLPLGEGALTAATPSAGALAITRERDGWRVEGRLERVPWARDAEAVALVADGWVARVPVEQTMVHEGRNLAGEPRDDLTLHAVDLPDQAVAPAPVGVDGDALRVRGALARAIAMAGALERTLTVTLDYAVERRQFGRPIAAFQAVAQQLAEAAGEVVAACACVDAAVERPDVERVGMAKVRAGDAATAVAQIAHQVHGAIGYTRELELHRLTQRLWSWRSEFGDEEAWAQRLGAVVAARGADALWPWLTAAQDDGPAAAALENRTPDPEER